MDDELQRQTSAWLTFSLAFDASARHCQHLRQEDRSPEQIGWLISDYLAGAGSSSATNSSATNAGNGSESELCEALRGELSVDQLRQLRHPALQQRVEQALAWQQACDHHHLIGFDHPLYPALLRDSVDAPPLLYAKGDLAALSCPALAIVGSRKASRAAIDFTHTLAARMAARGVAIVSGLARGIDAAAHEGALAVAGRTIAVAATEPESVYPKRHAALADRIIDNGGLIVTEYPLGSVTLRWFFPKRNRIISGLSLGVLVAEAGLPSGTLTTATHAMNQGREVMAIPGSVHNPLTRGCHALIKQGAALVESEQDVLDALAWPLARQLEMDINSTERSTVEQSKSEQLKAKQLKSEQEKGEQEKDKQINSGQIVEEAAYPDSLENLILAALTATPATLDDLMAQFDSSVTELSTLLGRLEIDGRIIAGAGGRYTPCHIKR